MTASSRWHHPAVKAHSTFAGIYASVGQRHGRTLFEELKTSTSLQPRITISKAAAAAIALFVHGLTVLFVAGGAVLILWHSNPTLVFLGACSLLVAWAVHPRMPKTPKSVARREDLPFLYALVDVVSKSVGGDPISGIELTPEFNAAVSRAGWKRQSYLRLGLPLFAVLAPQERVALLGHEMGHLVNGDPRRGAFIGTAVSTLSAWHSVLRPYSAGRNGEGSVMVFANIILAPIAGLIRLVGWLLLHLIWRDGQRAEYLADSMAREAAGTDAAASCLSTLSMAMIFHETVQNTTLAGRDEVDVFEEFKRRCDERGSPEAERVHRKETEEGFRLDGKHPPTVYRIEFVRSATVSPQVTLSTADSEKLDLELAPYRRRLQQVLMDGYRASLYRGSRRR